MLSAVYDGEGIELKQKPVPDLGPGEVLVRVQAAAICGTDLRILAEGHKKLDPGSDSVLGHEFTGKVAKIGSDVDGIQQGDRIVIAPNIGCGQCDQCLRGNHHRCPDYRAIGISLDGGFAEYFVAPREAVERGNLIPVPETVPPEEAVLTEPLSTCYNAQLTCGFTMGDKVLIVGAGPMGILHTILARFGGASKIILSEVNESRRARAQEFGADKTLDPKDIELVEATDELTEGKGVDHAYVAAPAAKAQAAALQSAAIEGCVHFFATLPEEQSIKEFPSNLLHYRQVKVTGSSGASIGHLNDVLQIIATARLPLAEVVTHTYSLNEIDRAVDKAASEDSLKVLVKP